MKPATQTTHNINPNTLNRFKNQNIIKKTEAYKIEIRILDYKELIQLYFKKKKKREKINTKPIIASTLLLTFK